MVVLTLKQQYGRTTYLAVCFLLMFTAYNSLQNMISKLYKDQGYNNLGLTAVLLIYFSMGTATICSSYIIRKLGYKKAMFFSSLAYALFEGSGLLIVSKMEMDSTTVQVIICSCALVCGLGASLIWIAQGAYISLIAQQSRKNEMFGLFWGIMMSSQILGNILGTFILGTISNLIYFIVLTVIGLASAFMFLLVPNIEDDKQNSKNISKISLRQQISKFMAIIRDSRYKYLRYYFLYPGVTICFYAGFIFKVIGNSLPKNQGETDDSYNQRLSLFQGYAFIGLGISQALTGFSLNRFSERFCKFKLATIAMLVVQLAVFMSFLAYFQNSYGLCVTSVVLWGISETFLQSNTGAIIATIFPNQVESYSVFRIYFSLGVVITMIANIALSDAPLWVFLIIMLALQIIQTIISLQLIKLKPKSNEKQSLISNEASAEVKAETVF